MTADEKVQTARRWRAFYDEPGGLGEMLGRMTSAHMKEAVDSEPWETDRLKKVALSLRLIGELNQAVQAVMSDGAIAEHATEHAKRIADLPEHKKRWI